MNIEKALEYQLWRLKNSKPSKKDIEAFNSILDWKELQEAKVVRHNESLAKLWMHQLILLSETEMYNGQRSIQVIDEILSKSVYQWVTTLKDKLNIMRFKAVISESGVLLPKDRNNITELRKTMLEGLNKHPGEAQKAFDDEIKETNVIKFVNKMVNSVINKHDK